MGCRNIRPIITISGKRSRIRVWKDVVRILGKPSYVRIYQNMGMKAIALSECDCKDDLSFKVPYGAALDGKQDFEIYSIQFIYDLLTMNHLETDGTYRIPGKWVDEKKMVVFHLSDAVKVR